MKTALTCLLATAALFSCSPAYAQAARVCMPQAKALADQLGEQYGEVLTGAGVDVHGNLVQIYSSDAEGTWTIAVTLPGGPTCIVSLGEGWNRAMDIQPKPGRES